MDWKQKVVIVFFLLPLSTSAQKEIPTFKVEPRSMLVWDETIPEMDVSSTIWDPTTGNEIHRLSHSGVEVSSRVGYERISPNKEGTFFNYSTTVANTTDFEISVQYGGASVDGQRALPLWVISTGKGRHGRNGEEKWELSTMHCFKSGFSSDENLFSGPGVTQKIVVPPQSSKTVSFVTKDPRISALLCSTGGCHPKGVVRYYVTVNRTDYVFVWRGPSIPYCGA